MIAINQWPTQNFIFWWYKFNCGAGVSHIMYLAGCRSCCPVPLRNNAEQQFWRYKLYSLGSTLQKQLGLLDLCTSVKQSERLKLADAIYWKLWKTETLILQTGHRQRLRPVESNHFRWPRVIFNVIHPLQAFQMRFFVQLCSSWQHSNDTACRAVPLQQLSFLLIL